MTSETMRRSRDRWAAAAAVLALAIVALGFWTYVQLGKKNALLDQSRQLFDAEHAALVRALSEKP